MAQIRDYIRDQRETISLAPIVPNDGNYGFLQQAGSVYKNGFSDLQLYADSGGVTQLVLNTDYELALNDEDWTNDEAGYSDKTVYMQFKVTNVVYQNVTLYATFTNFGVYTSADANFDMVGGSETVTTSATLVVPFGYTRYRFNFDSSSGDIAPTIGSGAFDGQQIILNEVGGGNVAYVAGSGVNDILFNESHLYTWNGTDNLWKTDATITEYASNSSTTNADDTTSFVYGAGGSDGIIGNTALTAGRKKRVEFTKSIKDTDNIFIELYSPLSKTWSSSPIAVGGEPISIGYIYRDANGGIVISAINTTTLDILFFNTPYGFSARPWNDAAYSGVKWRVRKVSNGS